MTCAGSTPVKPLVEPLVAVSEPAMVEAQKLQHGGVEVADVHRVLDDVVREFVGLAVDRARPRAAAGHPHREAARVMVAAVVRRATGRLASRSSGRIRRPR